MDIFDSCWCRGWRRLRLRWSLRGIARAASPVFHPSVLCCVLKTSALQMYLAGNLVALTVDSSTCDVAGTYRARVLCCRTRVGMYVVEKSRVVLAASESDESVQPLRADPMLEKPLHGLEE